MESIIKVTNLTKVYKDQKAVNKVNLDIKKGEIYGLVGKNGAGKSTILKMLTGLTNKTEGSISLFGNETTWFKERHRMGAIIENPELVPALTGRENLEYFRIQRGIVDKSVVAEALESVGLQNVGKKKFKNYSVGMKQRLALALTLMSNPEVLILDEPTSGIDPEGIVEIRKLLKHLSEDKGVTIIISSHILSEIANLVTRVGIIDKGEIIEELDLGEIYDKSSEFVMLDTSDNAKALAIIEGNYEIDRMEVNGKNQILIYDNFEIMEDVIKKLVLENIGIKEVRREHKSLEDYFLEATGGHEIV